MSELLVQRKNNVEDRWQPEDHITKMPFEEHIEKSNKKNIILVVIYLSLLIGSLFTI